MHKRRTMRVEYFKKKSRSNPSIINISFATYRTMSFIITGCPSILRSLSIQEDSHINMPELGQISLQPISFTAKSNLQHENDLSQRKINRKKNCSPIGSVEILKTFRTIFLDTLWRENVRKDLLKRVRSIPVKISLQINHLESYHSNYIWTKMASTLYKQ